MKRIFSWISWFLVLSLLLSACSSKTGSHLDKIKQAGVIKVGTSADYPPFEYVDENG